MSNNLTLRINMDDCVGDSVSKHNYNLLSLDTTICNLSSQFFNVENNYFTNFVDLCANINNFNEFANLFINPSRLNKTTTATRVLSSYWSKHEFTITFPINIYDLNTPYRAVKNYIDFSTPPATLIQNGLNLLNANFPASQFLPNTKANVVFLLFSNSGQMYTTRTQAFTITSRIFNITNRKDDVNISTIRIGTYIVSPTLTWTSFGALI